MLKWNDFSRSVAALTLVAGLAAAPQTVLGEDVGPAFDAKQNEAIEALVRQYLLDHPEVVVEALQLYEQRQQAAEAERQKTVILALADQLNANPEDPVIGNPAGDVTLVEFFDYRCPYCKRMTETLAEMINEDPDLRVVMKEFPILSRESVQAARAALAAQSQGKYEAFHFALMENGGGFSEDEILAVADLVGLDTKRLQDEMQDPALEEVLRNNHALAEKIGITGTPAFVIGDRMIPGAISLDELRARIAEARAKAS
ncbi:MAG: DsbA family protein [Kiloniellaceae bacterium]